MLKKPFYGLKYASRKFWIKVREVYEETGIKRFPGDEGFYYCHGEKVVLEGMISSYVDDFILAGKDEFVEDITEKLKEKLDISKKEDGVFRLTRIDLKMIGEKVEICMTNYSNDLEKINFRDGKPDEILTKEEMMNSRQNIGKLSWLVAETR